MKKMCATCINYDGRQCLNDEKSVYCYGVPTLCGEYCKGWAPGVDRSESYRDSEEVFIRVGLPYMRREGTITKKLERWAKDWQKKFGKVEPATWPEEEPVEEPVEAEPEVVTEEEEPVEVCGRRRTCQTIRGSHGKSGGSKKMNYTGYDMFKEYCLKYGKEQAIAICKRYLDLQAPKALTNKAELEFCQQLYSAIM